MPEYLSPGVYMEEIDVGPKPIEGVSTSNLGILGMTERGPLDVRLISSWLEFQRLYGDPLAGVHLAPAVRGFFDNGGARCFMARVMDDAATTAALAPAGGLQINAIGAGAWGNNMLVRINAASLPGDPPDQFRVTVLYYVGVVPDPAAPGFVDPTSAGAEAQAGFVRPDVIEVFDNLTARENATTEVLRQLGGSNLIRAAWDPAVARAQPPLGAAYTQMAGGSNEGTVPVPPAPPAPPAVDIADYQGRQVTENRMGADFIFDTGLNGLAAVDEISLLAAPDEHSIAPNIRDAVIQQCHTLRDRFAVLSVPASSRQVGGILPNPPTSFAALYWPWIKMGHPRTGQSILVPPVGHMAGIMARTDIERGVHKAPANAVVRGAFDLEFTVSRAQQDILNPRGVNVIRDFRADRRGIRLWGARTMSADPSWKYVNVRRLFLFLEESIDEGTQWVVFEPNAEPLWDRVRRSIENFLLTVWRNGALMGVNPAEAFYVKCDRTTMTQDDIDNGRLICYIGVAPVKPAEFVIFRIHQWALGANTAV